MKADQITKNNETEMEFLKRNVAILTLLVFLTIIGTIIIFELIDQKQHIKFIPTAKNSGELGWNSWQKGDLLNAEKHFINAYAMDQNNTEILEALGTITLIDGRYNDSKGYFAQFLQRRPYNINVHSQVAICDLKLKNYKDLESRCINILTNYDKSKHGIFHLLLAVMYFEQDKESLCVQHFVDASTIYNKNFELILRGSDWAKAILSYEPVLKMIEEKNLFFLNETTEEDEKDK